MATSSDLQRYKSIEDTLRKRVNSASSNPSQSDVQADISLRNIQAQADQARSDIARERLSGYDNTTQGSEKKQGYIGRALDLLGMPLYSIVGGVETALGKGTEKGLLANIKSNVEEKEGFGDLLRKEGVTNPWLTIPIGFALDVAFDPLTWLTLGTSAALPKLAVGATKGLKGVSAAGKAIGLEKAAGAMKWIPGVRNESFKIAGTFENLQKKAAKAGQAYNQIIGKDVLKSLEKTPAIKQGFKNIGEAIRSTPKGESFVKAFKYDPSEHFWNTVKESRMKGEFLNKLTKAGFIKGDEYSRMSLKSALDRAAEKLDKGDDTLRSAKDLLNDKMSEAALVATDGADLARTFDGEKRAMAMLGEAKDDQMVRDIIREFTERHVAFEKKIGRAAPDQTGIGWYDALTDKARSIKVRDVALGEKIAERYKDFIYLFKTAKIGGNPAAFANAIMGNPTMAMLAGLDVVDPEYFKAVKEGLNLINGKLSPDVIKHLKSSDWFTLLRDNPDVIRHVWGVNPEVLTNEEFLKDIVERHAREVLGHEQISKKIVDEDAMTIAKKAQEMLAKGKFKEVTRALGTPQSISKTDDELITSFISTDLGKSEFLKWVESKKDTSAVFKAIHWYLTKPLSQYEKIDQSYKVGTSIFLTRHGLNEGQLKTLSKFIDIAPKDIRVVDPVTGRYRLSVVKALEASNMIYMNYAAMPGGVKVLRSLPFLGSPFASFMYAMAQKTGQSLAYNPATFNKIQFLLKEISGGKSPLENKALDEPYNLWYNREGMTKLPFFQKNPVYINLANMIPYYTMNIFEPAEERKYADRLGSKVANIFDSLPIGKTPEMQLFFDYIIQPAILRETNPKGSFNQLLWPENASGLEKTGYFARQAAETVLPNLIAFPLAAITPEQFIESIPLYRARQIGQAARGKTAVGVKGKEPAFQRTARAIASTYAGLPFYQLNLNYAK